jgi:hypothetical protein
MVHEASARSSMDKPEAVNPHDAIPVREPEEPYAGLPGHTRYECIHLVEADGSLRSIALCRAINARTHPELKVRALAGTLHRLEDGRELALSFVYHDPLTRKFALVVPSALAHLELKEWSKLMADIADDTLHAVPAYVKEATTVLGIAALERYLESDLQAIDERALQAREQRLAERERELAEQELALSRLMHGLTSREGALDRRTDQLDTTLRELDHREHELRDRTRPSELVALAQRLRQRVGNWQELGLINAGDNEATLVSELPWRGPSDGAPHELDGSRALGLRNHPPPLPYRRSLPPPLPHRQRSITPPPLALRRDDGAPPSVRTRSSIPPPLPTHDALVTEATDPAPEVAAPGHFSSQRAGSMVWKLAEDELWLYVQLDEARASAFRHGADLMLQYAELERYPVCVLSLVDQPPQRYALRVALDGRAGADLRAIEHLSRSFRARVALYVDGLYIETTTVAVLREGVAQAVQDKIKKLPLEKPTLGAAEILQRVLHQPPPLWNDDLPFGPARREAPTLDTVLAASEQLAAWLKPEKLACATLTYSVPRHVIDATIRRITHAAIAFGVALPDDLLGLAVQQGAAPDERTALQDQLLAFRQRVELQQNDLGLAATSANWQKLLAAADARGVEVDEASRALASLAHAAADGPDPAPESVAGAGAGDTWLDELQAKLLDPLERLDAIRSLCGRRQLAAIEPVLALLDRLPPHEVAVAAAQLTLFGEDAGDGLIEALSSEHDATRQCAGLALGRIQLRRALVALVRQLELEDTPVYAEIARAFGDFGQAALRSLMRAVPGSARVDRLVLALAHLANHGCAREIERLENDPDADLAQAARKAMARRSRMEWEDLAVREQRTLTDASAATRLSQAFYAEASKLAI